jgi:hypothetical protein
MSLAPPRIVQPTARTRTLNDENKNGFTDSSNPQRLPPHRYPSFSSPAPSDSAASPRQPQTSDAHHAGHAAIPPTAEATSEDRRRSSCDSDSTRSNSRCLRPRLAVGANREAGVAGSPRPKSPARATFDSGSAACPRPEGQRAKSSERRRQEGKTSSTVSAPGGYRCARDSVEASHCYDV